MEETTVEQISEVKQTIWQWLTSDDMLAVFIVSVFWIAVIAIVAVIVDKAASKFLRKVLYRDQIPLSGAKIIINVIRFCIWFAAVGFVLDTVFNVDVGGIVTALGIGGIAISLGCQDTLSNLISGVQVSLQGIIDIGDRVEISGREGVVEDCNWRHMIIRDSDGDAICVPNSVINTTSLVHKADFVLVETSVLLRYEHVGEGKTLDDFVEEIRPSISQAVSELAEVVEGPIFRFTSMTDFGYQGTVIFKLKPGSLAPVVKDAIIRQIAQLGL